MNDPDPPLELRLAGPPRLRRGSRELALDRKAAGALAWLALRGPVLRLRLAELLWPGVAADSARNNLRQLIFRLKKAMDTVVIDGQDELRLPPTMRLDTDADTLLEGCNFDDCPAFAAWLETARDAQRERSHASRLKAAEAALAAGDQTQAVALARALVADDELSEAAHRCLVQALYLRGERAAALEAASRCEVLMRESLGVPLSEPMQRLVAIVRSAEAPAALAASIPVSVLRPPRLIGRANELALLQQARRERRVALVAGEPGLGKSRLLVEAAALTGDRVLGARPGDAGIPFAALARWLRTLHESFPDALARLPPALHRLLPELVPEGPGRGRLDLQRAVAEVFVAAQVAGLSGVWLDDMHFADQASIEALQALLDESRLATLPWGLARRPAEGSAALQALADRLLDDGQLMPVTLRPLDAAQVAELIDSLAVPGLDGGALGEELSRRTGGNPLFVLETIKEILVSPASEGAGAVRPRTVGALIERRLRQLSPAALALARVAALAGPDFDTDLAVHVLGVPLMGLADAWAELESAQVLRDRAFAHDLIFEATLASVPAAIRRHARRSIAEFLAPRNGEPARIAEHWLAAGEPARAAPHFVAAGRRAEAAARYAEARLLFERAADCHEQAGEAARALDTRLALADLLMEAREFAASQSVLDALQTAVGTVDDRIRVCMQQMHLLMREGRDDKALELGEHAIADAEWREEATPQRLASLRWTHANALLQQDRAAEALAQLQLAEPLLAASDDPSWRCWFHSQHAVALNQLGEVAQAAAAQKKALEAARLVGRRRMVAGCLQNGATFAATGGHLVEALDQLDECLLLMADTGGDDHLTHHVRVQRGRVLAALGRYREVIEILEPLTGDDSPLPSDTRARALMTLVDVWIQLGQPARAQAALRASQACATGPLERISLQHARTELAWFADRPQDESLAAAEALPAGVPLNARNDILRWRAHPDRVDLSELAARRARWDACGLAGHVVVAETLAAEVAWRRGDGAAAAQWAARALPVSRRALLVGTYRPWLLLVLARSAAAADKELARRALREGADWIQSVLRLHVPEPFRDSFLARNRINRELLALAREPTG